MVVGLNLYNYMCTCTVDHDYMDFNDMRARYFMVHLERSIRKWVHFITYNLNRYIFRNINAIGFLLLTQHTTPLLCVKIHFGVLHMRGTDVTRSDTP